MRLTAYGVDYDAVAPVYDANPYRKKEPDAELVRLITERPPGPVRVLDVGCGTGSQLVANLSAPALAGRVRLVGLDPFGGMLRVAQAKSREIEWVRGDGMRLPFADGSFDYVTNQFSHHHMNRPERMLREVFPVLRPGGRFVLTNIAPRAMAAAQLYRWFPDAYKADLRAHPPAEALERHAADAGFGNVGTHLTESAWETDLASLAASYSRRRDDSRLNALPDDVYERCIVALREAAEGDRTPVRDLVAVLTLRADRP